MSRPRPGQKVRGSRSGRPIMVLFDVFGRRWALRVLWELRGAPLTFRELRDACGDPSPSVLNERLAELRELALVDATPGGYTLTPEGFGLCGLLYPLDRWAERWAKRL